MCWPLTKCTKANVQVTHPQRLKISLIQMITMYHRCVALTTSGRLRELKNKENDQLVNPKSGRLRMPEAVAYESF